MIVKLTFPPSVTAVRYGGSNLRPDLDNTLSIPAFMGKTLLTIQGVTGPSLSGTESDLLSALAPSEEWEADYLFFAFGIAPPVTDKIARAVALLADRGAPAVSMT